MQKSPIFYVAIGFIVAFFIMGILAFVVPAFRPAVFYKFVRGMGFPAGPTSEAGLCSNGNDDDADWAIDCADSDCSTDPTCMGGSGGTGGGGLTSEAGLCSNGIDDDADWAIDCADSDCSTDPACKGGTGGMGGIGG